MDKQWVYLNNQFLLATEGSYRNMQKIGSFTLNALNATITGSAAGDPAEVTFFTSLRDRLAAPLADFRDKYTSWTATQGEQKGQTSELAARLALLRSEKIEAWDLAIQNVYRRSSPQYQALLPNFRAPFQKGSQQDRINAVRALNSVASNDTALPASLKSDIAAFLAGFETSLNSSGQKKNKTTQLSSRLEEARVTLGGHLYGIMALLMNHYCSQPANVAHFFDLETIRNHEQTEFRHKVKAGTIYLVMTHSFDEDEEIRLINDGKVALRFFLVVQQSDGPGSVTVTVEPGKEQKVKPAQLGNAAHRFLKAQNMDETQDGHYVVVLI